MPNMRDPRFAKTVIYMCAHNHDGAVGLIINRLVGSLSFSELLEQLGIESGSVCEPILPKVHFGGPVEPERGFVLHSSDYLREESMPISKTMALTANLNILRDIASGEGPRDRILALGYAGWGPGQLDGEMQENAWLSVDSDRTLVFDDDIDGKWARGLVKIGIDASLLSTEAGRA
ncbi:MAG: hypothetical protein CMM47_11660 [Rhodospirillaceae bacterium]|nr:hypothetical protein [Rhodospirillaceae bacterium]